MVDVSGIYIVTDPAADDCQDPDRPSTNRVTDPAEAPARSDSVGILFRALLAPDSRQLTDNPLHQRRSD
jgi:hypothetical protein